MAASVPVTVASADDTQASGNVTAKSALRYSGREKNSTYQCSEGVNGVIRNWLVGLKETPMTTSNGSMIRANTQYTKTLSRNPRPIIVASALREPARAAGTSTAE